VSKVHREKPIKILFSTPLQFIRPAKDTERVFPRKPVPNNESAVFTERTTVSAREAACDQTFICCKISRRLEKPRRPQSDRQQSNNNNQTNSPISG
jgi:hypothetical protein